MIRPVGQREGVVGELDDVRAPAYGIELPGSVQIVRQRDLVYGYASRMQVHDRLEYDAMRRAEEVLGHELHHHLLEDLGVEHAGGEDRLLGFYVAGNRLLRRFGIVVQWH